MNKLIYQGDLVILHNMEREKYNGLYVLKRMLTTPTGGVHFCFVNNQNEEVVMELDQLDNYIKAVTPMPKPTICKF